MLTEKERAERRDYRQRHKERDRAVNNARKRRYRARKQLDPQFREERAYYDFARREGQGFDRLKAWQKANPEKVAEKNRRRAARRTERQTKKNRLRHLRTCQDQAALQARIVARAKSATAFIFTAELRAEVTGRLVEGVYSGDLPVKLTKGHAQELMREHFRLFSKFDTVSLDEVIGEDGFTLGAAMGVY